MRIAEIGHGLYPQWSVHRQKGEGKICGVRNSAFRVGNHAQKNGNSHLGAIHIDIPIFRDSHEPYVLTTFGI